MSGSRRQGARDEGVAEKTQLTRDDWLDAAGREIAAGGFDNARVLVLAKKLGVTRGSFYWHFRDHQDLITSFLERWRHRRIRELESWLPSGSGDVRAETHRIMHLLLGDSPRAAQRLRVELAVRDFARRDAFAARVVAEVDEARLAQNAHVLERMAPGAPGVEDLSLLLYVATVGSQLVLAGPREDGPAAGRAEELIANVILEWYERNTGDTPSGGA